MAKKNKPEATKSLVPATEDMEALEAALADSAPEAVGDSAPDPVRDPRRAAIKADIAEATRLSTIPVGFQAGRSSGGLVTRVNAAKARLKQLNQELQDLNNAEAVICQANVNATDELISLLEEEGPVVVLDADQPYQDLAEQILPICNKSLEFGTNQFIRLMEVLGAWGREHKVASMPRPAFKARVCRELPQLTRHIRGLIEEAFDGEYASMCLRPVLDESANKIGFQGTVPVVVVNDAQGTVSRNLAKNARALIQFQARANATAEQNATAILDMLEATAKNA